MASPCYSCNRRPRRKPHRLASVVVLVLEVVVVFESSGQHCVRTLCELTFQHSEHGFGVHTNVYIHIHISIYVMCMHMYIYNINYIYIYIERERERAKKSARERESQYRDTYYSDPPMQVEQPDFYYRVGILTGE